MFQSDMDLELQKVENPCGRVLHNVNFAIRGWALCRRPCISNFLQQPRLKNTFTRKWCS